MKKHVVKTEVSLDTKMALMNIAQKEKRSMRKQLEYIIEQFIKSQIMVESISGITPKAWKGPLSTNLKQTLRSKGWDIPKVEALLKEKEDDAEIDN